MKKTKQKLKSTDQPGLDIIQPRFSLKTAEHISQWMVLNLLNFQNII